VLSFVDTHCHIDLPDFSEDRDDVLRRALAAGVHAMIVIGFDPERWRTSSALAERLPFVRRTAGIHPNSADQWSDAVASTLERELRRGDAVAIGEIGLDFYRDTVAPDRQRRAFDEQLQLAAALRLPVVIHQRAAEDEVLEALDRAGAPAGVMHCFSGDRAFAEECVRRGYYLGIGGAITYPRSGAIREAVATTPLERLLVETDAPYLAPQPQRGRRNEPALARSALDAIATLHRTTIDRVAQVTSSNAATLFGSSLSEAQAHGRRLAPC
jgi:TatD DNase family protein